MVADPGGGGERSIEHKLREMCAQYEASTVGTTTGARTDRIRLGYGQDTDRARTGYGDPVSGPCGPCGPYPGPCAVRNLSIRVRSVSSHTDGREVADE